MKKTVEFIGDEIVGGNVLVFILKGKMGGSI